MRIILLLSISLILVAGCSNSDREPAEQTPLSVSSTMGSTVDPGFARALTPREFVFPDDHGPHPEYATEWWYFTGNLKTDRNEAFGYQLTLFRVGLKPGSSADDSNWRSHQLYMGHLAVSDMTRQQHLSDERFSRAAAGLAGAANDPLQVWLGPWSINGSDNDIFPLTLHAASERFGIDLTVQAGSKPVVLQGDRGLSQKSAAAGNASYYYSYTRLPTSGSIRVEDRVFEVVGNSWFDREWSSSALAADQAGWDWFSLQLDSGQDLMFYQMRGKDGLPQIYSKGVLVDRQGRVEPLSLESTLLRVTDTWTSANGTRYPTGWQMSIPGHAIDISIRAAFDDQEMAHTVRYWEGAVRVDGSHQGLGYLELSGYADD